MKKLGQKLTMALCKLSDFQAGCLYVGVAVLIIVLGVL